MSNQRRRLHRLKQLRRPRTTPLMALKHEHEDGNEAAALFPVAPLPDAGRPPPLQIPRSGVNLTGKPRDKGKKDRERGKRRHIAMIDLARWIEHLERHLPLAREGTQPAGAHQVRVATRRIEAWLVLAGQRALRDDLGWLRRLAAPVRDCHVLLTRQPPAPFAQWLEERRQLAQSALAAGIASPRAKALCRALHLLPGLERAGAITRLPRIVERVLDAGDRIERKPDGIAQYHALRRRLKTLRYALDWLGLKSKDIKALQEALGQLNDVATELACLEASGMSGELPEHVAEREAALDIQRTESLRAWLAARSDIAALEYACDEDAKDDKSTR